MPMTLFESPRTAYQKLPTSLYQATASRTTGQFYRGFTCDYDVKPNASTDAIYLGHISQITCLQDIASPGHIVGALGFARMNATGKTCHLAIGVEGKIRNLGGTITYAIGLESNFEVNSGTVTNHYGVNSTVAANGGTIGEFRGVMVQAPATTGTITNMVGVWVQGPGAGTTITNYTGFRVENSTLPSGSAVGVYSNIAAAGGGTRYNINAAGDAANYFRGEVRIGQDMGGGVGTQLAVNGAIAIADGMTAPTATAGAAKIFVDIADGDLKVIFGDGTPKTIVIDT